MKKAIVFMAGILLTVSACDDQQQQVDNVDDGPARLMNADEAEALETIEFEDGAVLAFYETEPGALMYMQWGPIGARIPVEKELAAQRLTAVELYEHLTNEKAPTTIIEAQNRLEAAIDQGGFEDAEYQFEVDDATEADGNIAVKKQAVIVYDCKEPMSDREYFNCNACTPGDFDITYRGRTGDLNRSVTGAEYTKGGVYTLSGGVRFSAVKNNRTLVERYVPAGDWLITQVWGTNMKSEANVSLASGDRYDYCFNGDL